MASTRTDEALPPDSPLSGDREYEVAALLDAARDLASTLELRPLLELLLDHLGRVVEYAGTAILTLDDAGDELTFAHMRGPASFTWEQARRIRYRVEDLHPHWERLCQDQPIVIPDIRGETAEARTFCRLVGEDELGTTYTFIRSVMWVPLVVRGRIIGPFLEIADDGAGFEPSLRGGDGFGLPGMRERAERLGGTLQIESAPGAGTRVRLEVPR